MSADRGWQPEGEAGPSPSGAGPKKHDFAHGHGLRVTTCGDALDHHVPADDALKLTVVPADAKLAYPEFAHPVTRLPQGLSFADARHIRLRGLSRTGHRGPLLSP